MDNTKNDLHHYLLPGIMDTGYIASGLFKNRQGGSYVDCGDN